MVIHLKSRIHYNNLHQVSDSQFVYKLLKRMILSFEMETGHFNVI